MERHESLTADAYTNVSAMTATLAAELFDRVRRRALFVVLCVASISPAAAAMQDVSPLPTLVRTPLGMEFVLVPAGEFVMGSDEKALDAQWTALSALTTTPSRTLIAAQSPAHRVAISRPFYLGRYELTRAQWRAIMGTDPSPVPDCGDSCPVSNVSWTDAEAFIARLNDRHDGHHYRLPTEAEWEYAARAGGEPLTGAALDAAAWHGGNAGQRPHPVGQKQPNAWGLHDMLGNIWEWVQDRYDVSYYRASPVLDPRGPETGGTREARGGGFMEPSFFSSPTWRAPGKQPDTATFDIGLRVLMEAPAAGRSGARRPVP
jgi:formylglycine-generating enzyme required for sulfatase activity